MPDKKSIIIKIRVDSQTHAEMQSRADRYTDGNLSAFVRCATLKYEEQPVADRDNPRMIALIKSAIKLIERIGTNNNQVVKHINEQQKMFPYSLRAADLLPFGQFCEGTDKIQQMLTYLYNMIISGK